MQNDYYLLIKNFRTSSDEGQIFYWLNQNFKKKIHAAVAGAVIACYLPGVLVSEGEDHETIASVLRQSRDEFACWLNHAKSVKKFEEPPSIRVLVKVRLPLDNSDVGRCLKWLKANEEIDLESGILDAVRLVFLPVSKAAWGLNEVPLLIDTARLVMQDQLDLSGYSSPGTIYGQISEDAKSEDTKLDKILIPVGETAQQIGTSSLESEPEVDLDMDFEF